MKKSIYISGIITVNIFVMGALFKVLHWPGAGILVTTGLVLFALVFLPLSFYQSYTALGRRNMHLYLAGLICAFITFTGALFKIQHWPGAGVLLLIGIPLPFLYFLPVYLYHFNKSKEKNMLNFLGVMFMMVYVALFTSILSLNTSKNILDALKGNASDLQQTASLLQLNNENIYAVSNAASTQEKAEQLKILWDNTTQLCRWIDRLKADLVELTEEDNSPALQANDSINTGAITAIDETLRSSIVMRGTDGIPGKASELHEKIDVYRNYLLTQTANDSLAGASISKLLSTEDIVEEYSGETQSMTWEDYYFRNGSFLISILSNLDGLKIKIRIAEAVALAHFRSANL